MSNSGIGFIGLGQMGLGMANNLGQVARPFYAYDALSEATKRLEGDDVIIASSVSNMAQNCHLIFLCLPSAKEVKEVIFGPDGIVDSALPNLSIIDTSTIDRPEAISIHNQLAGKGITYADCPISGLPFRATDGTLTLMFGGSRDLFDTTKQELDAMGEFIVYCGESGAGQMMKAVNNIIYNINIVALCEVLPLAVAGGLSTDALTKVVTTASSRSFAADHFIPRMLQRQFNNDFAMENAYKDIINIQRIAIENRALTPLVNAMTSSYQTAISAGLGSEPKSAIIKIYEQVLGTEFSNK